MRNSVPEGTLKLGRRILLLAMFSLSVGIALLIFTTDSALAFLVTITHTTVADFNKGFFFRTGLTSSTVAGGDGNGEVRLLTIGINPATWNPGGTANTTGLPALWGHAAVQKNGRIYVSGGRTSSTTTAGVFYATINTLTHNLSNWTTSTNSLPNPRVAHGMAAANNYLYVIGGLTSPASPPTSTVLVALINGDGSIGTWSSTTSLPAALSDFTTVAVGGTIYVLGGQDINGIAKSPVYYATPNAGTGAISSWNTASAPLPKATSRQSAATFSGTIYQFGGTDLFTFYPDVLHTTPSGGGNISSWITDTSPLPSNLTYAAGVAFGGQAYVAGGAYQQAQFITSTIASNLINPDGSILNTSWANSDVLSQPRQRAAAVLSDDGWIYVIEGNNSAGGSLPLNTIDYGPTAAAGATSYAPSGNYVSAVVDFGSNHTLSSIKWNSTVTSTPSVSLSLQYRFGTSLPLAGPWSSPYGAVPGNLMLNSINNISQTARYVQYQANYTTTISNLTPALNSVNVVFDVPYGVLLPLIRR